MRFGKIMTITTVNQLYRTYLTKVPVINGACFQKNSQKPLLQAHSIHKFASKFEYSSDDDYQFCYKHLEPTVNPNALTRGNRSLEKKLKIILFEIYNYRNEHLPIPDKLQEKHYKMLLNIPTDSIRKTFLLELKKFNARNQIRLSKRSEFLEINKLNHIWYGCEHNSMLMKILLEEVEDKVLNLVPCGMLNDNHIVIDLSYEDHMEVNEMSQCVRDLYNILYYNKIASSSFNIHLCNVKKKGKIIKLYNSMHKENFDDIFGIVHEENYLNIFPHEKLVYLSPHANDEIVSYDSDHIYIIGGVYDKFPFNHPYSYNKAISENITVRRFPLDEILNWKRGSKTLGVYMTFKILSDFSYYRSWDMAFRNLNLKYVENHHFLNSVTQYRNILTALEKNN